MDHRIQHFSHDHRLTLGLDAEGLCNMCGLNCKGVVYSCKRCSFHIHQTCAELKREINHPFHPQHQLTLLSQPPYSSGKFQCHACGKFSLTSTYHCAECKFDLDLNCAVLMPSKATTESSHEKECKINHFFCNPHPHSHPHPHPLIRCETEKKIKVYCAGCKLVIEKSSIYVCLECKSMLHKSCSELPQVMEHPFHPDHSLTLLPRPPYSTGEFICNACGGVHAGLTFRCSECEFDLDINCASLMPVSTTDHQQQEDDQIDRFIICKSSNKKNEFPFVCYACQLPFINGSSMYCCLKYNVLLHKSCAELPCEIQHLLHPYHPLKFSAWSRNISADKFECKACLREDYGCGYECLDCKFFLDIPCALSKPLVANSTFHKHPLVFCDVVAKNIRCHICHQFRKCPFFRCVVCNFSVHLLCVPTLPHTASDGNHRHPLTLTKSWVRDHEDEDEYAQFYCDRCENERRLHDPTYYCTECHYVAHVHCVIYETRDEEVWSLPYELGDIKGDIDGEIEALDTKMNDQRKKLKELMKIYLPDHEFILEQLAIKKEELVDKKHTLQNESRDSFANSLAEMEFHHSLSHEAWF